MDKCKWEGERVCVRKREKGGERVRQKERQIDGENPRVKGEKIGELVKCLDSE